MLQKNKIITILSALLVLFTFSSCHDDDDENYNKTAQKMTTRYDTGFKIYVRDSDYNDILNPDTEGHLNIDNIQVFTSDVLNPVMKVNNWIDIHTSRGGIAGGIPTPPSIEVSAFKDTDKRCFLSIGFYFQTVPVGEKKMDVVTIRWGDGTSDTFSYIVKANSEKDLTFSYYINGEPNYGDTFFITKR